MMDELGNFDTLFAYTAAQMAAYEFFPKVAVRKFDFEGNFSFQVDGVNEEYLWLITEDERIMLHSVFRFLNSDVPQLLENMKWNQGLDHPEFTGCHLPYPLEMREEDKILEHEISIRLIRLTHYDSPLQKIFKKYLVQRMVNIYEDMSWIQPGGGCLIEYDTPLCDL